MESRPHILRRDIQHGREFQIIKRFYDPPRLQSDLQALGWQAVVGRTAEFFIHGTATPPAADQS